MSSASLFDSVVFMTSAHELTQLPQDHGSEVAFAGRSNVGKSSALNSLTRRKRLAFFSKTPGRTQTLNFYGTGSQRLVDLPGYGYAAVPAHERRHWGTLISGYLASRQTLRGLVVLMDARHPWTPLDEQLLAWYAPLRKPLCVLLTKADKLTPAQGRKVLAETQQRLTREFPDATAILFSAVKGTGRQTAQKTVAAWLGENKRPPVKGE
jgi:GTP-binding protein